MTRSAIQPTPRYIVAKYAPDIARMEPRNIGVIVWYKGEFAAKFLDAIDAAAIGVADSDTYERWVAFWSRLIAEQAIRPRRGRPVSSKDPSCIDAVLSTQRGNYILMDGGELLNPVKKSELPEVTGYLFNDLVATGKQKKRAASATFRQACHAMMREIDIEVHEHRPISCAWKGVTRTLHPDYYVGNGSPSAIFQRVELSNEKSVNGGALLVDLILNQGLVGPESCRFLLRTSNIASESAEADLRLCERLCGYIDIDAVDAIEQLRNTISVPLPLRGSALVTHSS